MIGDGQTFISTVSQYIPLYRPSILPEYIQQSPPSSNSLLFILILARKDITYLLCKSVIMSSFSGCKSIFFLSNAISTRSITFLMIGDTTLQGQTDRRRAKIVRADERVRRVPGCPHRTVRRTPDNVQERLQLYST